MDAAERAKAYASSARARAHAYGKRVAKSGAAAAPAAKTPAATRLAAATRPAAATRGARKARAEGRAASAELGPVVYSGGAKIPVADMGRKATRDVFVKVRVRLAGGTSSDALRRGPRELLVAAIEPETKAESEARVRARAFSDRQHLAAPSTREALAAVGDWLAGKPQPRGDVISRALASVLCATFVPAVPRGAAASLKLHCDPHLRQRMDDRLRERAASAPRREAPSQQRPESEDAAEFAGATFAADRQMKRDTKRRASRKPGAHIAAVSVASAAFRESEAALEHQRQELAERRTIRKAREAVSRNAMLRTQVETKERRQANREYKELLNGALNSRIKENRVAAKARRERVKHQREMERAKWAAFPFRSGAGTWKRGAKLGPGPIPVRALALSRSGRPARPQSAPATAAAAGSCPAARARALQSERLRAVFDLVRKLASTNDDYYLDLKGAFARLDRSSKGFVTRGDLELMLGGLYVTDEDLDLLWAHFDRDNNGFIEQDDLVRGFYAQRGLLRRAKAADETAAFRHDVLAHAALRSAQGRAEENITVRVQLGGVRDLARMPGRPQRIFCVVSCCRVEKEGGDKVVVITDEKRSGDARLPAAGAQTVWKHGGALYFRRGTMAERRGEHLLVECRAGDPHAESDAHSVLLGEVFLPLLDLEAATCSGEDSRWLRLRHGGHGGQIALRVELQGAESLGWSSASASSDNDGDDDEWEDNLSVPESSSASSPLSSAWSNSIQDGDVEALSDGSANADRTAAEQLLGELLHSTCSKQREKVKAPHDSPHHRQAGALLEDLLRDYAAS